jgi:gliding motility-associated lipoprotein GldH
MSKWRIGVFLAGILLLGSCDQERLFEDFQSVENQKWSSIDSMKFDLSTLKNLGSSQLIALRFEDSYGFSNCYVRVISKDSTGRILENKLINVPLFDSKSGKPLGKGFGNTYTKYDTLPFDLLPQTKSLTFLQYMRQEELAGIDAVGLKILK